jgi:phosphate transport system substrate-binding protein
MEWIDGSKHLAPLLGADTELPEYIHNGTHGAYVNLIEGRADLILVARSPSSDEVELTQRERVQLDVRPVALDAFVFILNEDNPVENLTIDHLRAIYTGELVNWRDVGGEEAEIHPYQRNENSGSQELMKSLVMKDLLILDVPPMVLPKMIAPFYAVSDDPLGIGYSVYYYEQNMAPNERVKLCAVEGIDPHPQSISSKAYPFTTEVYVVIREDLSPESSAYRMRDWLLSSEGQVVVEESGYVPLK